MKMLHNLDLSKNELQNARIQNLASAPSTPVVGQVYFDTASGAEYVWNGTAWRPSDAAKLTDGSIQNTALATNPLARANHTGTQTAATISDFDTQVRTSRLDQMAAPIADMSMNSRKITGLATPTAGTDAANKQYVDDNLAGLSWKEEVVCATTANITLSGTQTIDGYSATAGERVLVKDQSTQSQNGIYIVAAGAWSRASDADSDTDIKGAAVFVANGTTNGGTRWACNTTGTITVGTTAIGFVQFGGGATYTAGAGLTLTGSTFDVGAGNGISVAADAISVDPAVVVRKYATDIGDGSTLSYTVTHNLNTKDVTVALRQNSDDSHVFANIVSATVNTITVAFAAAPATNAIRCVVHG